MIKNKINFEKLYFYIIVVFAFLLPLSRAAVSLFTILLPIIWFFEGDFKRKILKIKKSPVLKYLLVFLLFCFISILWTQNLDDAKRPIRLLFYFLTTFVIATSLKPKYINTIVSTFLLGMLLSEIIAYGVFFNLWQFNVATPQNPTPFMHHIDYSVFLAFTSILLLYRIFSKEYSLKQKTIYLIFFSTVTGNLFLTFGRTGEVAFLVALMVLVFLRYHFNFKAFFIFLATAFILLFTAYNISHTFQKRITQAKEDFQNITKQNYNSSLGIRTAYYILSAKAIKKSPIIGYGIGDFKDAIREQLKKQDPNFVDNVTKKFIKNHTPHNQYLTILLQTGFFGFSLFILFAYNFFKLPIKNKQLKDYSILFMTILLVSFMADTLLMKQFVLTLFAFFTGIFVSASKIQDSQ